MPQEIERKFLVDTTHPELAAILAQPGERITQGYLPVDFTITARLPQGGASAGTISFADNALLGPIAIPAEDAAAIRSELCEPGSDRLDMQISTARLRFKGARAYFTLKGQTSGISRSEFEYEVDHAAAWQLSKLWCDAFVIKTRRNWPLGQDLVAEIDVFEGQDLVLAEVELPDERAEFDWPAWFGAEVSDSPVYFNSRIAEALAQGLPIGV